MKMRCIKDFYMGSGKIAFTAGKIYNFASTDIYTYKVISDISTMHLMHDTNIKGHFIKLENIDEILNKELFEI